MENKDGETSLNPSEVSLGPPAAEPDPSSTGRPKALFWNRPLVSDWIFWLVIGFMLIGGGQSLYRTGQNYPYMPQRQFLIVGGIDVLAQVFLNLLLLGLFPASIRFLMRKISLQRKLRTKPISSRIGWKVDPTNQERYRWWSESGWTQATYPQPRSEFGKAGVAIFLAASVALAGALLAGFSTSYVDPASANQPQPATSEGVERREVKVDRLKIGDCLGDGLASNDFTSQVVVPCSEPHFSEVFAMVQVTGASFDKERIMNDAFVKCARRFEAYTGIPPERSNLHFNLIHPNKAGYESGDRTVYCLLLNPDGLETTGSLRAP